VKLLRLAAFISVAAASAWAQAPSIAAGGVLDGASFARGQAVAPGSLVSIFGGALANALQQNDTVPLSPSIGGVSVTMNNVPAGLYFVSSGQINAQVPWNVLSSGSNGTANVVVTRNGQASAPLAIQIAPYTAAIFTLTPGGSGYALAINADGSVVAPAGTFPGIASRPAKVGETIVIYANGLGPVDAAIANGANSLDRLRNTTTVPVVNIGGTSAKVVFSGLAPQFPGVNQLNVTIPDIAANNSAPVSITIGGQTTPTGPILAITR